MIVWWCRWSALFVGCVGLRQCGGINCQCADLDQVVGEDSVSGPDPGTFGTVDAGAVPVVSAFEALEHLFVRLRPQRRSWCSGQRGRAHRELPLVLPHLVHRRRARIQGASAPTHGVVARRRRSRLQASKAGVKMLGRRLRLELARHGVGVTIRSARSFRPAGEVSTSFA